MANVAFGIRQDAEGIGTTDTDLRKIIQARWNNTGILAGLNVTGQTSLTYKVAPGVAVCSRAKSDGFTEAYFGGGNTPAVKANTSANPRIDVVWITAHDKSQGDSDNLVTIGVTEGTAAVVPVKPTIPTFAVEIAAVTLPGGAANTSNAQVSDDRNYAIPYGASLGVMLDITDTSYKAIYKDAAYVFASGQIYLPTDRMVNFDLTETTWAYNPTTNNWQGSGYVDLVIDGTVVAAYRFINFVNTPATQCFHDVRKLKAGVHTVQARLWASGTEPKSDLWLDYSAGSWPGQRLIVTDGGVAE